MTTSYRPLPSTVSAELAMVCQLCGALVWSVVLHDDFHDPTYLRGPRTVDSPPPEVEEWFQIQYETPGDIWEDDYWGRAGSLEDAVVLRDELAAESEAPHRIVRITQTVVATTQGGTDE